MRVVRTFSAALKEELVGRIKAGASARAASAETGGFAVRFISGLRPTGQMDRLGSIGSGDGRVRARDCRLGPWRKGRRRPASALPPWALRMTFRRRKPGSPNSSAWWTATARPRFFSRSLAVMGSGEPKRRRAHLFGVIEKMTREGPQGETTSPTRASVERLARLAGLSRASY